MARRDIQIIQIRAVKSGTINDFEIKIKYGKDYKTIVAKVDYTRGENFPQAIREYVKANKLSGTIRFEEYDTGKELPCDTSKNQYTKQLKHWEYGHHERGLRDYILQVTK